MSSVNKGNFISSSPICMPFLVLCPVQCWSPCPVPDLGEKASSFSPLSMMLAIGFLSVSLFFGGRGSTGRWMQGLVLARQVFYHLSHASSPFCIGYFWDRVSLYVQASLDDGPCIHASPIARMTDLCCCAQLLLVCEMGLTNFLDYRHMPSHLAYKTIHSKNRIVFCNLLFSTSPYMYSIPIQCSLGNLMWGLQVCPRIFKIDTSDCKSAWSVLGWPNSVSSFIKQW
jgi:hypothetical protein